MRRQATTRLALSALAVVAIGATTIGVAITRPAPARIQERPGLTNVLPEPLAIADLAPGDAAQRVITVHNGGDQTIHRLWFSLDANRTIRIGTIVPAPPGKRTPAGYRWERHCVGRPRRCRITLQPIPSPLVHARLGLSAKLETCSRPWRRVPGSTQRYVCRGERRAVLFSRRLPTRARIHNLPRVRPGRDWHFRLTLKLPPRSGNELQRRRVTLVPRFTTAPLR